MIARNSSFTYKGQAVDVKRVGRELGVPYVLEVPGEDPGVLVNAAHALAYFGEDIGAMMALVDRALALNPSFARAAGTSAAP